MQTRQQLPAQARPRAFAPRPIHALLLSALACWQVEMRASQIERTDAALQPQSAPNVEFDPTILHGGGPPVDLSRFSQSNVTAPGLYSPDIHVNGQWMGRQEVRFTEVAGRRDAQPCFDLALLQLAGISTAALQAAGSADPACTRLDQAVADASASFDFARLRLDLSIPQAALQRQALGHVSPDQWSEGVPVGLLGYQFNTHHSRAGSRGAATQSYLGLNSGLNLGRWYFRHNGSMSWDDRGNRSYQNIAAYVQRDVADLSSQLVIGDTFTPGDLLDSTSFRGVRLQTDDRMLPESQRGYAPVVRGVANSNARVTITQGGVKLRETTVAPGAFVIDDLYPTGYGGDLQVSVTEADGSVRSFAVPYAAVPRSLREGQHRYSLTAGTVRNLRHTAPFFSQGTWQYGLSNQITAYGGATVAKGHLTAMAGGVLTTHWGAFGLDLSHASSRIPGEGAYSGQSLRGSFAKTFEESGTHVALAAYRYSTSGFFGLNDAMLAREGAQAGRPLSELYRPRTRTSLTLGQRLGPRGGSLSLSASTASYWNRAGSNADFSVSYSNSWGIVPYQLSATRQRNAWGQSGTQLYLGLFIPLGGDRPMVMTSLNRDAQGRLRTQASFSGTLGEDHRAAYGLNANYSNGGSDSGLQGGAYASYRSGFAEFGGSLGAGAGRRQFSASASGAIVAHPGGITLSQPLKGDTFAIVEARHAEGARLTNAPGVRVDGRGYAIVPYLTPYAMNQVSLDPKGLSTDVELHETHQAVAPLAGAAPLLVFKTSYGRSAVLRLKQDNGTPVPFGAAVSDMDGKDLGVVGQAGKLLVRGLQDQGELQVRWQPKAGGADAAVHAGCSLSYALPPRQRAPGYQPPQSLELPCVASGPAQPTPQAATRRSTWQASQQPLGTERTLAGMRLATRIHSLPMPVQAPQAPQDREARATAAPPPHALRIERNLVHVRPGTLISATTPDRT